MPTHPLSECGSGTPQENPTALRAMFSGQGSTQHQSILDFVLLNAGAALYVAGAASKFNEGVAKAREAVESGKAKRAMEEYAVACASAAVS